MPDNQFHELRLEGKQLVFLFMATLTVAVVVFLCGVMVGRGVRALQLDPSTEIAAAAGRDPTDVLDPTDLETRAGAPGPEVAGAQDDLTYLNRLSGTTPPPDVLSEPEPGPRPVAPPPPPPPAPPVATPPQSAPAQSAPATPARQAVTVPAPSAPARSNTPPPRTAERAASSAPTTQGSGRYVVQVMSVSRRADADAAVTRLASKGYPSFVASAPQGFRVRVGPYADRPAADAAARRLEREERISKPWVTTQ